MHVRIFTSAVPVGAAEVQASSDNAHGGGFHKALLISAAGFSDEAIAAADGTAVELIDGGRLDELMDIRRTRGLEPIEA